MYFGILQRHGLSVAVVRGAEPLRAPTRARSRRRHLRGRGNGDRHHPRAGDRDRAECRRARDPGGVHPRRCRHRGAGVGRARGGAGAGATPLPVGPRAGGVAAHAGLHRDPQRPATRLLPQHLQGRRRRHPHHRRHPVRGHRRAASLPVLGRARRQGGVLRHPGGPDRARRHLQHRGGERGAGGGRPPGACASPTRSRCPPTWSPSSWASWRPPRR